jgi:hypothetical protein
MGLHSVVIPAAEIDEPQLTVMLRIMQTYYVNVSAVQFRADLKVKDMVILLCEDRDIRGFSTWKLDHHQIGQRSVNVIFSGDTIIEKDSWRSLALPIAWGRLMLATQEQFADRELYWLLTSKGYKTYRYLPVFFREFYPSYRRETPDFEKALLTSLASLKFGNRFDESSGILIASGRDQRLRPGVADITEGRRKDRHVAFFEKANPGHARGDELVCLANCQPSNINSFIMRFLKP